jgi:hypothetical protein
LSLIEISIAGQPTAQTAKKPHLKRTKPKLTVEEKQELADAVSSAFKPLAQRYYLDGEVEPHVSVASGRIMVSVPVVEL